MDKINPYLKGGFYVCRVLIHYNAFFIKPPEE